MRECVFTAIAVGFLSVTLYSVLTAPTAIVGAIFCVELFVFAAFYLFQFGSLSQFSVKGLTAEATFIRNIASEAGKDADQIKQLQDEASRTVQQINSLQEKAAANEKLIGRLVGIAELTINRVDRIQEQSDLHSSATSDLARDIAEAKDKIHEVEDQPPRVV